MQQDAHEFLNFLINHINEIILGMQISLHMYIHMYMYIIADPYNINFMCLIFQQREVKANQQEENVVQVMLVHHQSLHGFMKYFKEF